MNSQIEPVGDERKEKQSTKCVVWDLDNTLWNGVLLEDENVTLRKSVVDVIQALDRRGILQSIASRNDAALAMAKLQGFGLAEYFLYPQINWGSKSASIRTIVKSLNIGMDTIAFVDDQPFEREEVQFELPEVLCIDAAELPHILEMPQLNPRFVTGDSMLRRKMYMSDVVRNQDEAAYEGPQEAFLASLDMRLDIFPAAEEDLQRAEELTIRTHQLNATGYTYSYDELNSFRQAEDYLLLMARLEDKYGPYGNIGLALVERGGQIWTLKLMLMSCRVMSRGIGSIMLNYVMNLAQANRVRLQAEFVPTDCNRLMDITYRFANFREIYRDERLVIFEHDLANIQTYPDYVNISFAAEAALSQQEVFRS